jgi:toxin-antitoxin system PIN domain toxin
MILVDANLLLYAYNTDAPEHKAAKKWLEDTLALPSPFGLSWITITAFIRISTNPRAFPKPLKIKEAIEIITELLDHPTVTILQPTERHWDLLKQMLVKGQVSGPLTTDAQVATLAIEHGATLYTTDRDFARFPKLKFHNPLST